MRSKRAALALALAASAIAAAPGTAGAADPPAKAHAAGGDAVQLIYPSLVRIRYNRAERALDRAGRKIDAGQLDKAATALKVVRRQTAAAWRGTKYVIRTTPPPPAEEDLFRPRARKSGGAPAGPTYAAPPDTAFKVLGLMHDVSSEMVQQIDGAHGAGLAPLSTTLNWVNNRRDQAIQYIFSVAPPAPATEDVFRPRARKAGDPVVTTFDTVMPNVTPDLDDEIQAIDGLKSDATDLTVGGRRLLNAAENQIEATRTFVNTKWPPVPVED